MTATTADYMRLLGLRPDTRPSVESLAQLQLQHLYTVPFENLSIHCGEPIVLEQQALWNKIVTRRRGGFCFELNGAFAGLLSALGFDVTLLSAQVFDHGEPGPPLDHLALRVDLDEPWLVDVGFGRFARRPVPLNSRDRHTDDEADIHIVDTDHGDLDVYFDGAAAYRLDPKPRRLTDFDAMAWYHSHSPASPFTGRVSCSVATPDGRVTVSGNRLITTVDGDRTERTLNNADVVAAYRRYFGISLTRAPSVRAAT